MNLLLDTHALLWALISPEKLSANARRAITDPHNAVFVSAISFWEIALKTGIGKLTLVGTDAEGLLDAAESQGFTLLPLEPRLAAGFSKPPPFPQHRDPFDRMLIWQALSRGDTLVSRDRKILSSTITDLRTLW